MSPYLEVWWSSNQSLRLSIQWHFEKSCQHLITSPIISGVVITAWRREWGGGFSEVVLHISIKARLVFSLDYHSKNNIPTFLYSLIFLCVCDLLYECGDIEDSYSLRLHPSGVTDQRSICCILGSWLLI